MRTILTMVAALFLMTGCVNAKGIQKDYQAESFTSIDMEGVGKIAYSQGDNCSVRAEGDSALIARTKITFTEGVLHISQQGESMNNSDGLIFFITSPTLTKVSTEGVGSFEAKEPIVFDNDFEFNQEGVGSVKFANLTCKNLTFHQEGVGAAELKVNSDNVYYHSEGVGAGKLNVEANSLKLINEGVGAIKVKGHVKKYSPQRDGFVSRISDKNLIVGE